MPDILPLADAGPRDSRIPLAALILGGAAIGGSPIFVRLSEVGPLATAFWRVALALLPLLLVSLASRRKSAVQPRNLSECLMLVLPGLFLATDLVTWHLSIHMTSVANATLLANLAPIFVAAIGWLFLGARITTLFLLGLATALVGIVTLKGGLSGLANGDLRGDGLATVAALFYAGYILVIGRLRTRFDTLQIMVWSTAAATICLFPVALMIEGVMLPPSLFGWLMLIGLAFISHAGGQVAITYALAYLPAAFSSLTLLLQPVVAALLAWALLSESIGPLQAIGGAIVLAGILIARRG
ncbi:MULTISPECIES: DMT family transporter [Rhizobium]|uniref:DMT family transporter n=1 Tax=Rhizobium rhododendri TaxID=2506430 RepID=A0ABY8ILP9_9HYPH|nr:MULTISPECIES: DMT family transporter [Rhizobium]MBZ5758205.1 DMT family transporter [Rhizobium sp. VS19-DR96]MBZ5764965.1 DMT family transporter [Rhizobium sp. VS19-DR129.2]MBZ5772508.1 DMT family transporter [Rhizobium sp. VS19-DRK62.2]MBZ5782805.1 DMT family transporter [Rhizobium sp. VS19-DR121]MBZ5800253.1 DMT family transporter [Rhizobium sp. VS19-DR181]